MSEKFLPADSPEQLSALFGQLDGNISRIQKDFNVTVVSRDGGVKIIGEGDTEGAEKALRAIMNMAKNGSSVNEQTVRYVTSMVAEGVEEQLQELGGDGICVTASGKILRPRTVGQKRYTDAIKNNTIVLGIGPAGTGKTYLAVAMAVKAFREDRDARRVFVALLVADGAPSFVRGKDGLYGEGELPPGKLLQEAQEEVGMRRRVVLREDEEDVLQPAFHRLPALPAGGGDGDQEVPRIYFALAGAQSLIISFETPADIEVM